MVTSPPYMNNYHYVRNTRPQLYWLNFIASPGEQKYLETHNFGQYWQTVRDAEPVTLSFTHRALAATLEQLRTTRTAQGAYGGPGWANYVATYFNDCCRFAEVLKRVLVPGGVGVQDDLVSLVTQCKSVIILSGMPVCGMPRCFLSLEA